MMYGSGGSFLIIWRGWGVGELHLVIPFHSKRNKDSEMSRGLRVFCLTFRFVSSKALRKREKRKKEKKKKREIHPGFIK